MVTLAFVQPLIELIQHAGQSSLNSYIPLVPFVAGYLLYLRRKTLPTVFRSSIAGAVVLCGVGALALVAASRVERDTQRQRWPRPDGARLCERHRRRWFPVPWLELDGRRGLSRSRS